ncbi:MAG: polysaccharide deacetylase family protein, partial [Actinobacteria bacterium]|nr:polysaccharide deacetylase family protein [Actinomycetota bacterium]
MPADSAAGQLDGSPMRAAARIVAFLVFVAGLVAPQTAIAQVDTPGELLVVITSPSENSVVTSQVDVVAEASDGTVEVQFFVSTDGGVTWTPLGTDTTPADGWMATWESGTYSGEALLRAQASDGVSQASDEVNVTVDNSPPEVTAEVSETVFSPNGDGRKDSTVLTARSSEPADLTLQIIDNEGRVRRSWSSTERTTTFNIKWNGRGAQRPLPDGRYTLRAKGVDRVGLRDHAATRVVIDTRAPRIRSLRMGPKLFFKSGTLTADYSLRDRSSDFAVKLEIRGHLGSVGAIKRISGENGEIHFATRYPDGKVLYPGRYSARLIVRDDAGNATRSRRILWRMHRPARARVFKRLNNVGRRVALTIDDCNDPAVWARMLDILESFHTKATFFCSGQQVVRNPELARRTVASGHAIGSHGWDHQYMKGRPQSETEWRIRADARAWWDLAHETTAPFYRPAYGYHDRNGLDAAGATAHGRVIIWDVDSIDYGTPSSTVISERVVRETRPGSIVLLHVLDRTADALPSILRGLSRRQLDPVNLYRFFR